MKTQILKGEPLQNKIMFEVKNELTEVKKKYSQSPGIAFIAFEGTPLAKYTIPLHINMAESLGFITKTKIINPKANEEEVYSVIDNFNADKQIHAIVILQPVPIELNAIRLSNRINPEKEVEGFHPSNMLATMVPEIKTQHYTMLLPNALKQILSYYNFILQQDKLWVFLLDDDFYNNRLTKMIVHTAALGVIPNNNQVLFINKTSENIIKYCKMADYLVIVTKFPEYVKPEWLKKGVCIIDIYSNLVNEIPSKNNPKKLIPIIRGGINIGSVEGIARAVIPVPGGLMTVVLPLLFMNSLLAFKKSIAVKNEVSVSIV